MAIPFCLSRESSKNDMCLAALLNELRNARTQPVFHTYVSDPSEVTGGSRAVICTTNEKVHLAFGKLSETALGWITKLFEEWTQLDGQLVFSFEDEHGQPSRNLFVTASKNDAGIRVFHVSPGH